MSVYFGRGKKRYELENKIGSGGEGTIYSIKCISNSVAKIYFDSKLQGTQRTFLKEKIETMIDQPVRAYVNNVLYVAWPQDVLFDATGLFVGYIMPKVNSKYHIFAASRERERVMLFPKYSWRTAVTVAYNLATAVKIVHDSGAVIGDMNPNNIMIDNNGLITLIDTDSFTIKNKRTKKTYKCGVGISEMLAPELQGRDLRDEKSIFSEKSDDFSLAIHIFNLLMNNCHPFGCLNHNRMQSSTSMNPLVKNIVNGYCPYVNGKKGSLAAPDIKMLPESIQKLFKRAFYYTSSSAILSDTIKKRPSASEWQVELRKVLDSDLTICKKNPIHLYPSHNIRCPWCENDAQVNRMCKATTYPLNKYRIISKTKAKKTNTWIFWGICIFVGVISMLILTPIISQEIEGVLNTNITKQNYYYLMGTLGALSGGWIAHHFKDHFTRAKNKWPWLLVSLLSPLCSILIILIIYIGIVIIMFLVSCALVFGIMYGMVSVVGGS